MRYLFLAMVLLLSACANESSNLDPHASGDVPHVDFSEGPVVTMASTTQVGILNDSLRDGLSIDKAHAIRSESHDFAHYIAAPVDGLESGNDVGLWFMYDGMDIPGEGFAVNDVAIKTTNFRRFSEHQEVDIASSHEVEVLLDFIDKIR